MALLRQRVAKHTKRYTTFCAPIAFHKNMKRIYIKKINMKVAMQHLSIF